MKFYFTDETNVHRNPQLGFFVYGGIIVDESELRPLSEDIFKIKKQFGLEKERPIKWSNNKWHGHELDPLLHKEIKGLILDQFSRSSVKIIISLSPQDFYHSSTFLGIKRVEKVDQEKQKVTHKYAINTSLQKFNHYLEEAGSLGMVLADNFAESMREYLTLHCFSLYPDGTTVSPLTNITFPVVQLNNEYSQLHQVNDVVLGCFSYSMMEMSVNLLPRMTNNFWHGDKDNIMSILGRGFNTYPKRPQSLQLQKEIQLLKDKFIRRLQ